MGLFGGKKYREEYELELLKQSNPYRYYVLQEQKSRAALRKKTERIKKDAQTRVDGADQDLM